MIREVNLADYIPLYMQDFSEIKEILNTENIEFQTIDDESETILDNQFIFTCSEVGIKRFEDMLGIKALDDDTLENRRFKVLSVWDNAVPYSIRALKEKLAVLCGEAGYTLNVYYDTYSIKVRIALKNMKNYVQAENMLRAVIPCNMLMDLSLLYNQHSTLKGFTNRQLKEFTQYQIRNEVIT